MYIACSTLGFRHLGLEDALQTLRELRFPKADLAISDKSPHLTPADIAADIGRVTQRLKASNLPLAAIRLDVDSAAREALRATCRLARVCTVPIVSIRPAPLGSDFDAEIVRLKEWERIAAADGLILAIETDINTIAADPLGAAECCHRVPGLGVALDPSHYCVGPHAGANYDMLFPFVRHVRLRDTGTMLDQFQVRVGQGQIEYGRIISMLERVDYDRAVSVDIHDDPQSSFPIEPEVRKLKYLLESLV